MASRWAIAGLALAAAVGLSGCADEYGYSGLSVGYGTGYGDAYGYGGGYAYPAYYGWYDDYYYPGTGIYVYDSYRRPYRWNDVQRNYWEGRRGNYRGGGYPGNWGGFTREGYRYGQPGAGYYPGRRYDGQGYGGQGYGGQYGHHEHNDRDGDGDGGRWRGRGRR